MKNFVLFLLLLFVFFACNKKQELKSSVVLDDNYTGLKVGNSSFYNVIYIFHDAQVDRHDTLKFKMKSSIEDTFRDNANNLRYLIHRYRWNDTIATWVSLKTFSAFIDKNYYIESEDNIYKKKLYLPYSFNFTWNSDSFNAYDTLHFRYKDYISSIYFDQLKIDSVIQVKQQFFKSYIDLRRKSEFFAKNKGMVFRYFKDLKIKKGDTMNVEKGEEWYFKLYQFKSL